jgi:murein DD-endopeptidase MepM/ murein hydrolase activator NlpD
MFPERHVAPRDVTVEVGKSSFSALHDGKARVIVSAVSNDFRGKTTSQAFDVDVMTAAPRVSADGVQHYINQGGTELVTFTPTGAWTEAGVKVGDYTFRSFPLPNHPGEFFSLFAMFWSLPVDTPMYVYASNPSGALAKASFWYKVFPKKFRKSTLALESMNVDRMVNGIDPEHKIPGDVIQRFLYINGELRKKNNKTLADLRFQTADRFLWSGAFLPMVDSTVESRFADDRTYTWQGKKVDEQTHLGFDLAKLAHSPIPASNDGKVLWAEDLGIYGNCVVVDHGFGLQSFYGHMSEFLVKKGDMVKKGQVIGKTGSTGLAGGDHLHFGMQVDGVQINPVEWWDPHWVKDRILSKLGQEMGGAGVDAYAEAVKGHRKERRKKK